MSAPTIGYLADGDNHPRKWGSRDLTRVNSVVKSFCGPLAFVSTGEVVGRDSINVRDVTIKPHTPLQQRRVSKHTLAYLRFRH
jgi:hypothetical protein